MRSVNVSVPIPTTRWARASAALLIGLLGFVLLGASSCAPPDGQDKDAAIRQTGFNKLQATQPAVYMNWSPTRDAITFFAHTWEKPGKVSYVYLTNQAGAVVRYFVILGLPTSYCAQMLPPTTPDWGGSSVTQNPAPAVDGAYYGNSNVCNTYYGKDATTGKFVSWTQETGITQVSEQPIGRPETDRPELAGGPTVIGEEHK